MFLHVCTHATACTASPQHVPAPGPPRAMLAVSLWTDPQAHHPVLMVSVASLSPIFGPLLPSGCPSLIADVLRDARWRDLNVTQQVVRPGTRTLWDPTAVSNGVDTCHVALPPTQQPDKGASSHRGDAGTRVPRGRCPAQGHLCQEAKPGLCPHLPLGTPQSCLTPFLHPIPHGLCSTPGHPSCKNESFFCSHYIPDMGNDVPCSNPSSSFPSPQRGPP